uniref:hypothetical protein n=1 Tax=Pantoea vagans TaxID=470934 RepID=UPI0028991C99
ADGGLGGAKLWRCCGQGGALGDTDDVCIGSMRSLLLGLFIRATHNGFVWYQSTAYNRDAL